MSEHVSYKRPAIEFKSNTFTVPVLILGTNDLNIIAEQLKIKIKQAPEFFKNSPLLFDLQEIVKEKMDLDLIQLHKTVLDLQFIPIGIRGGTIEHNKIAHSISMAVFSNLHSKSGQTEKQTKTITPTTEQESDSDSESTVTRVLTQPVRSGQRIYVKGDLVILSPVSSGAEIMAEGNIHVYGALRGRALAGVQGNTESRIFCSDLQSELVSIAGHYKVSDDLDQTVRGKPVQIFLKDKALIIKDI